MDPRSLLPPLSPIGYPTPFWFIELFKVLGFTLHMVPMHIWYAGTLAAALFAGFGRGNLRIVGFHIARALPFLLAFGINFGIIPLLFMQVAYYRFFYPATVLMAWPWFMVFWLVMAAYFFTYLYRLVIRGGVAAETASVGKKEHSERGSRWLDRSGRVAIWLAAGIFIVVGFIFANAMSLLVNVGGWWAILRGANVSGAATGLALNLADPSLIPRWLFMFAMALTTTAVFVAVDAAYLSGRESEDYRRYAERFSFWMYTLGLLGFAGFGGWYLFGTRMEEVREMLRNPYMQILFPLTALSPGLPWLILLSQNRRPSTRKAALAGAAQFGVVALNAISRQWVQNRELLPFDNLARHPRNLQPGGMAMFIILFALGLAVVAWMVAQIIRVNRREWAQSREQGAAK